MNFERVHCVDCRDLVHVDETVLDGEQRRCIVCLEEGRMTLDADALVDGMDDAIRELGLLR